MPIFLYPTHIRHTRQGKKLALFFLILISMAFFALPRDLPAAVVQNGQLPETIPWQRIQELLDSRSFVSGDELFQLLYILYSQDPDAAFRLDRYILSRLQERISSLFPLEGCQAIEVRGGEVLFRFTDPQQVVVPNTWRQASLHLSERLILTIVDKPPAPDAAEDAGEADPETKSICFHVQEGAMQLHFSFLLEWLGGRMRDARGTDLIYRINETKKISRLQLIENTLLGGDRLKISRTPPAGKDQGSMQWIDILHPDFPGMQDIGIDDALITFLGTEVELLPDRMIRIGKDEPQKNERAWNWFANNISSFRDYAETGTLATTISYTRNFGYHFEERQVVVTLGFHGTDESPLHR